MKWRESQPSVRRLSGHSCLASSNTSQPSFKCTGLPRSISFILFHFHLPLYTLFLFFLVPLFNFFLLSSSLPQQRAISRPRVAAHLTLKKPAQTPPSQRPPSTGTSLLWLIPFVSKECGWHFLGVELDRHRFFPCIRNAFIFLYLDIKLLVWSCMVASDRNRNAIAAIKTNVQVKITNHPLIGRFLLLKSSETGHQRINNTVFILLRCGNEEEFSGLHCARCM